MSEEKTRNEKLHSLVPLADFKTLLGTDDRDDAMSRFCLVTATYTIEQYCMRRLFSKKHFEFIEYTGDLCLPLREYPVSEILAVYLLRKGDRVQETGELLESDFYSVMPDYGTDIDLPFFISLSPALKRYRGLTAVKAVYAAGYSQGKAPADLASACMELAAWNMSRFRGKRIGMTGSVNKDGDRLEISMPENVRGLLEPYKRKTI